MKKTDLEMFELQESEYEFPYHHLVELHPFSLNKLLPWGMEYGSYLKRVITEIEKLKPKSILDVGCGDGKLLFELARVGYAGTLMGIDLSPRAIQIAKAFSHNLPVTFEAKDLAEIDQTFDCVVLMETLEHVPDSDMAQLIQDVYRCLNRGGRVIVTVPSINRLLVEKHYRHYTIGMLKDDFKAFDLVKFEYIFKANFFSKIIQKIAAKLSTWYTPRQLLWSFSKRFLNAASATNGAHIFAVFERAM